MGAEDTHYDVLGLGQDASTAEIEAAVAQLAHVASALALTAPAQADALWLRIRQISRDLLSGEDRRAVYDRSLQARTAAPRPPLAAAPLPVLPVVADNAVRHGPTPKPVPASVRRRGWRSGAADLGVALALMAAVATLFLQPWNWAHSHATTPALALSANGPQRGNAYRSGDTVHLHWSSAGPGKLYKLQIGRGTRLSDRSIAFVPAWRTLLTQKTSYEFRAVGAQFYFWRVSAEGSVPGHFGRWSTPSILAVAAPQIGVPSARRGQSGTAVHPGRTRLCWSAVANAAGYRLRVDGKRPIATTHTCAKVTLKAGTHHWQVAATARGARLYIGPFSPAATIRAVAAQHHTTPVHHRARSTHRSGSTHRTGPTHRKPVAHSTHRSGSGQSTSGHGSGAVVVAPPSSVAVVYHPSSHPSARRTSSRHHSSPTTHRSRSHKPAARATHVPAPPRVPAVHRLPTGNQPPPPTTAPAKSAPAPTRSAPPAIPTATPAPQPTPTSGHVFYSAAVPPTPVPTQSQHEGYVSPPSPVSTPAR